MLGTSEAQVIIPRAGIAGLWRALDLRCSTATGAPLPGGRRKGPSKARPMTRRASGTLDLAAAIRPSAGDDPVLQFRRVGSRGSIFNERCQSQAAAAATETQGHVANLAAKSLPAQMGNLARSDDLPSMAVVALPNRSVRWLGRFPLCL